MNLFRKHKQTHRLREKTYGCQVGGLRRNWEFGMDVYTPLHLSNITNKDLLYSTGKSAQCYVAV